MEGFGFSGLTIFLLPFKNLVISWSICPSLTSKRTLSISLWSMQNVQEWLGEPCGLLWSTSIVLSMALGWWQVISTQSPQWRKGREERSGGSPPNARDMEEFNETISHCGLSSLKFDGPTYTWTNGVLWQRLDRAMTNGEWGDLFGFSKISHLARGRSDHALLLLKYGLSLPRGASFKFLNV